MTKKELLYGLNLLAANYHDGELNKYLIEIWWNSLNMFKFDFFFRAIKEHIEYDVSSFFPPVAKIRRLIIKNMNLVPPSEIAIGNVLSQANRYQIPVLDKLTSRVVEMMGGMNRFCNATINELGFLKKQFCELYDKLKLDYEKEIIEALPAPKREEKNLINLTKEKQWYN